MYLHVVFTCCIAPGGDGRPDQPEARRDDTNGGGGVAAASPTTGPPLPHLNHPPLFLSPSIPMGFMPQGFAVPGPISKRLCNIRMCL